jgi:hypothetical protein
MALVWLDSFKIYSNSIANMERKYPDSRLHPSSFVNGRTSRCLSFSGWHFTTPSLPESEVYTVGFAFQNVNLDRPITIMHFMNKHVSLNMTGEVFSIGGVCSRKIDVGAWYYLEMQLRTNPGSVTLKINEEVAIHCPFGVPEPKIDRVTFCSTCGKGAYLIDDLYIRNDDQFLGDVVVEAMLPNSEGEFSQWQPMQPGAPNYANVTHPHGDVGCVYTNQVNAIDTYHFQRPLLQGDIKGVMLNLMLRNTDSRKHEINPVVNMPSGRIELPHLTVTDTAYRFTPVVIENLPGEGGGVWTNEILAKTEFGVKLKS